MEEDKIRRVDRMDQCSGDDREDLSTMDGSDSNSLSSGETSGGRSEIGLTVTDRDDRILQWVQALDVQVLGACRSDERLKPLLKMNVSNGVAEERLLAQLSQHFEPAEIGILARCFYLPLVSVRVGKIDKQGTRMYPTSNRGNLNLTLLPTSDLCLSFVGDNGHVERIFTVSSKLQCSAVAFDEIKADSSGRSFLIKVLDGSVFYFWCCEKSKLLGIELLAKMKDLLKRKPSIAEISGICESRLDSFATHLRAFLMANSVASSVCTSVLSAEAVLDVNETSRNLPSTSKFLRSKHVGSQAVNANNPYQGILTRRSNSSIEGQPQNLSSLWSTARDFRWYGGDIQPAVENSTETSASTNDAFLNCLNLEKLPEIINSGTDASLLSESPGKLGIPPPFGPASQVPPFMPPLLSPHYCWCPPGTSSILFSSTSPPFLHPTADSSSIPSLSSMLPSSSSTSMLAPCPPLDLSSVNFPSFLSEPLVHLPLPTTQQIPTFTPLMCDTIVHIPVIDVCSLGQGYLVSASPEISTTIPTVHSKLANPVIPKTDSTLEDGARETLRLLLSGSTQANRHILDDLPDVLAHANEHLLLSGSRGLYCGASGADSIAKSIATMGLFPFSGAPKVNSDAKLSTSSGVSNELSQNGHEAGSTLLDDELEEREKPEQ